MYSAMLYKFLAVLLPEIGVLKQRLVLSVRAPRTASSALLFAGVMLWRNWTSRGKHGYNGISNTLPAL